MAYADFVTAMMALFIVLWMMNASQKVKTSISGYFNDPRSFARTTGARYQRTSRAKASWWIAITWRKIRKQLEQALSAMPEFQSLRNQVKFSVTGEGLRIDMLETEHGMFFVSGSAAPTPAGRNCCAFWPGRSRNCRTAW